MKCSQNFRVGSLITWLKTGIILTFILLIYLQVQINYSDVGKVHSHREDILIQLHDTDNGLHIVDKEFKSRQDKDLITENGAVNVNSLIANYESKGAIGNNLSNEKLHRKIKRQQMVGNDTLNNSVKDLAELNEVHTRNRGVFNYGPLYKVPGEDRNTEIPPIELIKRMNRIRASMSKSWARYKECAWGLDNLHPDTCRGSTWFGLGLTIIDSLDTLFIMGLKDELTEAREFITNLDYSKGNKNVNIFEITIRVLGAFLTMYNFTKDQLYLNKAVELGDLLITSKAFDTISGVPLSDIDLSTGISHRPTCSGCSSHSSLSEATTIQLEFNELTRLTKNPKYKAATDRVMFKILARLPPGGLPSVYVDVNSGSSSGAITLGARGDSYYEYLLKQWIQTKDTRLQNKYLEAIHAINAKLVFSSHRNLTYIAEIVRERQIEHKMDHLVCFLPGTLALGTMHGAPHWHLTLAESIIRTCVEMYNTRSGLAPEIVKFDDVKHSLFIYGNDDFSLLRPETVESLFILWRVTHKSVYRHWAWDIYSSIERHAKHPKYGYSSMKKINDVVPFRSDSLESFFLAETLKYLYLIHEPDDILPLSRYVFNTEAHPFPLGDFSRFMKREQ